MQITKISSIYATTKKKLSILKSKGYNTVKINSTLADYIICMKSNLPVGYLIPVCENSSSDLSPTLYQMTCKTVKINTISLKMHNQQVLPFSCSQLNYNQNKENPLQIDKYSLKMLSKVLNGQEMIFSNINLCIGTCM